MRNMTETSLVLDLPGHLLSARIVLDRPCEECSGDAVVQSPAWAEWWEKHEHLRMTAQRQGSDLADATNTANFFAGPEPDEPEEIPCPECEGIGFVPTEAGTAVLGLVTRYQGGRS